MKPEEIYDNLKQLAEKLNITVTEENLKRSGIKGRGGFCRVGGKKRFIIEKKLKPHEKVDILAEFLSSEHHEEIYLVPTVRDLLGRYSERGRNNEENRNPG